MDSSSRTMQWVQDHFVEDDPHTPAVVEERESDRIISELPCMKCTGRGQKRTIRISELKLPRRAQMCIQFQQLSAVSEQTPRGMIHPHQEAAPVPNVSSQRPKGRAQVLKARLKRLSERPVGGSMSETSSVASGDLPGFMSSIPAPDGLKAAPCFSDRLSVCSTQPPVDEDPEPTRQISTINQYMDKSHWDQLVCPDEKTERIQEDTSQFQDVPAGPDEDYSGQQDQDVLLQNNEMPLDQSKDLCIPIELHDHSKQDDMPESQDVNDDVIQNDDNHIEEQPIRRQKTTLHETAFLADLSTPIKFENNVKFHGGEPKFKGFMMAHKRTPEHFTLDEDFPELPLDDRVASKEVDDETAARENVVHSIKDLGALLLSDGVVSKEEEQPITDRPLYTIDSLLKPFSSEPNTPSNVPTLYIKNLPKDLSNDGETLLVETLQHYGEVLYFQLVDEKESKTALVRYDIEDAAELARDCFHENDSYFPENCLIAELSVES